MTELAFAVFGVICGLYLGLYVVRCDSYVRGYCDATDDAIAEIRRFAEDGPTA